MGVAVAAAGPVATPTAASAGCGCWNCPQVDAFVRKKASASLAGGLLMAAAEAAAAGCGGGSTVRSGDADALRAAAAARSPCAADVAQIATAQN